MNKQEKMKVMENAVAYAKGGAYNCLDCIGPGGWDYSTGGLHCRGSNSSDVARINTALRAIGLISEQVDEAAKLAGIVEGGGSLGLSEGCIHGCTNVDSFLGVVEGLL